ncbi:MAG: hypothetical protein EHM45_00710, partial [Desulfobacteraceae bacterium]
GGSTDKNGNNSVNFGGSFTVTATPNTGYHFTGWTGSLSGTTNPMTISNVTANMTVTANFAINTYTISGTVTAGVSGVSNVTMNGLPGSPRTNASGQYSATVNHDSSHIVTPSLVNYSFIPASYTHSHVTANQTQNYTATASTNYEISGRVTRNGAGLPGVTMNGFSGTVTTNPSGDYTATVARGSTVTVRPSLSGYSFSPVSQTHVNVIANLQNQNFTASANSTTPSADGGGGGGGCFVIASASGSWVMCLLLLPAGLILSRFRSLAKKE